MPLKFLEIAFRSLSSSPAGLLCFPRHRTAPRRPPPPRPTPTSPLLRAGTHASLRSFSTALGLALVPPPFATPPRTASRSPPRHRRGGLAAAPHSLLSRAHEHYFYPRKLFLSSFRLFRAPKPQNAVAAPLELRRAHPRRRPATTDPLHPRQPHHLLRLVLA